MSQNIQLKSYDRCLNTFDIEGSRPKKFNNHIWGNKSTVDINTSNNARQFVPQQLNSELQTNKSSITLGLNAQNIIAINGRRQIQNPNYQRQPDFFNIEPENKLNQKIMQSRLIQSKNQGLLNQQDNRQLSNLPLNNQNNNNNENLKEQINSIRNLSPSSRINPLYYQQNLDKNNNNSKVQLKTEGNQQVSYRLNPQIDTHNKLYQANTVKNNPRSQLIEQSIFDYPSYNQQDYVFDKPGVKYEQQVDLDQILEQKQRQLQQKQEQLQQLQQKQITDSQSNNQKSSMNSSNQYQQQQYQNNLQKNQEEKQSNQVISEQQNQFEDNKTKFYEGLTPQQKDSEQFKSYEQLKQKWKIEENANNNDYENYQHQQKQNEEILRKSQQNDEMIRQKSHQQQQLLKQMSSSSQQRRKSFQKPQLVDGNKEVFENNLNQFYKGYTPTITSRERYNNIEKIIQNSKENSPKKQVSEQLKQIQEEEKNFRETQQKLNNNNLKEQQLQEQYLPKLYESPMNGRRHFNNQQVNKQISFNPYQDQMGGFLQPQISSLQQRQSSRNGSQQQPQKQSRNSQQRNSNNKQQIDIIGGYFKGERKYERDQGFNPLDYQQNIKLLRNKRQSIKNVSQPDILSNIQHYQQGQSLYYNNNINNNNQNQKINNSMQENLVQRNDNINKKNNLSSQNIGQIDEQPLVTDLAGRYNGYQQANKNILQGEQQDYKVKDVELYKPSALKNLSAVKIY